MPAVQQNDLESQVPARNVVTMKLPHTLRRTTATIVLALFALGLAASAVPAAPAAVPTLTWQACASDSSFLCASASVPVDYHDPTGAQFTLAVIKAPANQPAAKIGTLFWNPGGPSDAGTVYLPAAINGFPQLVRDRFDIISWDPRGMGGGTVPVVQCYDTQAQEAAAFTKLYDTLPALPRSASEIATLLKGRAAINQACVAHAGTLLSHVSTVDNARDLDLLRQAVGEDEINYYGTSYGTFLGATYINLFPNHVRAAVLDGAVFPTAWMNADDDDPSTFIRIGSDLGAAETMKAFMLACGKAGKPRCPFAEGGPEQTLQKWQTLLRRLHANPVPVGDAKIDDTAAISFFMSSIYVIRPLKNFDRFPGYDAVAQFLQDLWSPPASPGGTTASSTAAGTNSAQTSDIYTDSYGRQASVICGESPNPTSVEADLGQALASYKRAGSGAWPFAAVCLGWSVRATERYFGPWNEPTPPVLVIGNRYDPATPFDSSVRMARELFDGHFLTVEGFGHTELLNPSRCAQAAIAAYLIDRIVPAQGTTCEQDDDPPFPR